MQPAILIMGPTASGKSALALDLAARFGGEIVSVDSAQVFRGMDIGTAKPDAATQAAVPHHLIDIRDPTERYSAAAFAAGRARGDWCDPRTRAPAAGRGRHDALLQGAHRGLVPPAVGDAHARADIDARAARLGWPALHASLRASIPRSPHGSRPPTRSASSAAWRSTS
jgi:tRNA dimethylallyltransferase